MSNIKDNEHVYLLPKIIFNDNQVITLSSMQIINKSVKDQLSLFLKDRLQISTEAYKSIPISSIVFSYGIRLGEITPTVGQKQDKNIKYQVYYRNELPIAMVPEDYGLILSQINNTYTISVNRGKLNAIIILTIKNKGDQTVNHIKYFKNNNLLFTWTDNIISFEEKKFIRKIGKSIIHYENGEFSLYTTIKKTRPIIKKQIIEDQLNNRFITMDLETITVNNKLIPYLLCWYDGAKAVKKSYFLVPLNEIKDLNYFSSVELDQYILDMVLDAMKDICIRKYKGYKIYLHNFSKFDGYFLTKQLSQLGIVKPIIHKGRIITTKFKFKLYESDYSVTFMDSYLMLPSSLKNLCNSFNIPLLSSKSIFPFLLDNINYQGVVPDFKYFKGINLLEYENYKEQWENNNKIWNFKEEAIAYCYLDCISLYQILIKFSQLIFDKFKLNITKYPTLPGLAFNLFKSRYLKKNTIHMLSGEIANNIRMGYTGGAVDMYLSKPIRNSKIYAYDVNSLYPFVMKNFMYPIGSPTYFKGDITKIESLPFGFFYCKISSSSHIQHPILQAHVRGKEGTRSVFPRGNWEGMYFRESYIMPKSMDINLRYYGGIPSKKDMFLKTMWIVYIILD
jgi:DNA polymerase type B, organellar and viral